MAVECPAVYGAGAGTVEGPAAYGAGTGTVEGPGLSENTSNHLFFSFAFIALDLAAYTCLLVLFGHFPDIVVTRSHRWTQ